MLATNNIQTAVISTWPTTVAVQIYHNPPALQLGKAAWRARHSRSNPRIYSARIAKKKRLGDRHESTTTSPQDKFSKRVQTGVAAKASTCLSVCPSVHHQRAEQQGANLASLILCALLGRLPGHELAPKLAKRGAAIVLATGPQPQASKGTRHARTCPPPRALPGFVASMYHLAKAGLQASRNGAETQTPGQLHHHPSSTTSKQQQQGAVPPP